MTRSRIFLWVQAAFCVLVCILLTAAVIEIWQEGLQLRAAGDVSEWVYTRQKIMERFGPISPLFFGAMGLTAAGLILGIGEKDRSKPIKDAETVRDFLCSQISAPSPSMLEERRKQKRLRLTGMILSGLCAVPVLIFLCNGAHFETADPERMIADTLLRTLPWVTVGLGCLTVTETLRMKSLRREAKAAEAQIKSGRTTAGKTEARAEKNGRITVIRILLLGLALGLLIHGIFNGSMRDVLVKAIHICSECIGLG